MNDIDSGAQQQGRSDEQTEKPSKPRVKRSIVLAVLLAVAAVLWIASGMFDGDSAPEQETVAERNAHEPEAIKVRVHDFTAVDHPRMLVVTGRTNAIKDAEIKAETAGQVIARPARKGTVVEKGTVLLELAMDDRLARLKQAEARVGVPKQSNRIDPLRFSEVDDDLLPLRFPPYKIDRVAHPRPADITIDQMLAAARSVC